MMILQKLNVPCSYTMIVVPNERLLSVVGRGTSFKDALKNGIGAMVALQSSNDAPERTFADVV